MIKKIILPITTLILLLIMVAWMAGSFSNKVGPGVQTKPALIITDTVAVVRRNVPLIEPVPATIEAKQATIISSRILSRIEKVHVRAGDTVKKGQLLIELEKSDLQSRVSQSKSQIRSVKARLTEAEQSLRRAKELTKTGVLAAADLDKAQANHDAYMADLSSAKQALNEAEAAISFSRIRSPINGRVVDRFAEPGDTAQPGIQMLSLYNPLSLRVEANVRETIALSLTLGQKIDVSIPAKNLTLKSEIDEMVPAGNSGSRSFLIKSSLDYTEGLLPGMYARMNISAGIQSLLLIPENRVAKVGQLNVVWVFANGQVERRFIRTGKTFEGGLIEVITGLNEHELLLVIPNNHI